MKTLPTPQGLQISSATGDAALSPEQKRFNSLIKQIEKLRQTLAGWHEVIPQYVRAHAQVIVPLLQSIRDVQRKWVFALDGLLQQPGWTKPERATLRELIANGAGGLLASQGPADEEDVELKALFDQHSEVDFDTEQQETRSALQAMLEASTGVDLGDPDEIRSEEELFQRMQEALQAHAAQAEAPAHEARASARRQTAAQKRREAEAQQATQSVREVFRKLASALHPDREPDAQARVAKTALMQKVNQAYAANDLLTLLELQLQVEQVDASHVGRASAQRLKHYNKVLAEQVAELKDEIVRVEAGFRMDFGLQADWHPSPKKMLASIDRAAKDLRANVAMIQQDLRRLGDKAVVKYMLRRERQRLRERESLLDDSFF
jgi:hypothetical protein